MNNDENQVKGRERKSDTLTEKINDKIKFKKKKKKSNRMCILL